MAGVASTIAGTLPTAPATALMPGRWPCTTTAQLRFTTAVQRRRRCGPVRTRVYRRHRGGGRGAAPPRVHRLPAALPPASSLTSRLRPRGTQAWLLRSPTAPTAPCVGASPRRRACTPCAPTRDGRRRHRRASAPDVCERRLLGFFWYDGSYADGPSPSRTPHASAPVHRRRVQRGRSAARGRTTFWTDNARFRLCRAAAPARRTDGSSSGMGGSYEFTGPDCLFVGGVQRYVSQRLNFTVDRRLRACARRRRARQRSWLGAVAAAAMLPRQRERTGTCDYASDGDQRREGGCRTGSFARPGGQPGPWPVTSLQLLEGEVQTLVLNV